MPGLAALLTLAAVAGKQLSAFGVVGKGYDVVATIIITPPALKWSLGRFAKRLGTSSMPPTATSDF